MKLRVREEMRKEERGGIYCQKLAGIIFDSLLYNGEYLTSPMQFSCWAKLSPNKILIHEPSKYRRQYLNNSSTLGVIMWRCKQAYYRIYLNIRGLSKLTLGIKFHRKEKGERKCLKQQIMTIFEIMLFEIPTSNRLIKNSISTQKDMKDFKLQNCTLTNEPTK